MLVFFTLRLVAEKMEEKTGFFFKPFLLCLWVCAYLHKYQCLQSLFSTFGKQPNRAKMETTSVFLTWWIQNIQLKKDYIRKMISQIRFPCSLSFRLFSDSNCVMVNQQRDFYWPFNPLREIKEEKRTCFIFFGIEKKRKVGKAEKRVFSTFILLGFWLSFSSLGC